MSTFKFEPHRAQVAALPIRTGPDGREVMLVTSRETRRWIAPKGWPMKGRKDHEAAAREAFEEAGITGKVHKHPIGAYTYMKRTGRHFEACRVMVYRLDVDEERSHWLEGDQRTRRWFSLADAARVVSEPGLATMIQSLDGHQAAAMSKRDPGHAMILDGRSLD